MGGCVFMSRCWFVKAQFISSACLHVIERFHSVCVVAMFAPCVHSTCKIAWNGCALGCSFGSCASDCVSVNVGVFSVCSIVGDDMANRGFLSA